MKKFKFTIRGNNYDVHIISIEDQTAEIDVNGTHYQVDIKSEVKSSKTPRLMRSKAAQNLSPGKLRTSHPAGTGTIKAPLPGVILGLKVKVGDTVSVGQTLLIMEAMKMENNIESDADGKVTAIKVKEGDAVLEGDLLIELEIEAIAVIETPQDAPQQQSVPAARQPSSQPAAAGTGIMKSPLPGVILEIKKNIGDDIKEGDIVFIMEAMKMENEIRSDFTGKLKTINVKTGDNVLEGDTLAEIGG